MKIRKGWLLLASVFLLCAGLAFSEESTNAGTTAASGGSPNFGMGLQFGTVTIDGTNYNTIRFQPDLALGKFGIGLDINFEFSAKGDFRFEEWNSAQAILSKILYIRWGQKGDMVYAKAGNINDFTLGHGVLMNRYSNMLNYPAYKKIGLAFDLDLKNFGLESMVANILDPDLFGGRIYVRPLLGSSLPIVNNLEIGATAVLDVDPQNENPPASSPYSYIFISTNSTNTVFAYGMDAGLPVINTPVVSMLGYMDFAAIGGSGSGEILGVAGSLVSFVPYQLELRILQPGFIPSYFDAYYDSARSSKYNTLHTAVTNGYVGWMLSSGVSLLEKKVIWTLQLEDSFGDASNPMLTMNFFLSPDLLKKVGLKLVWIRKNITKFSDVFEFKTADSIAILDLDYYISDEMALSIRYTRTYQLVNGTPVEFTSTSINTKLNF